MQFPVPQFTDVEDRIIGPLTMKQFGIVFAAGIFIFLVFSASKSIILTVLFGLLIGLPAIGLAFGKLNGRPLYNSLGSFLKFFTSPRVLIFHKEAHSGAAAFKDLQVSEESAVKAPADQQSTQDKMREVQRLLRQTEEKERGLIKDTNR